MNTTKILLIITAALGLVISSCDYVIDPEEVTVGGGGGGTGTSDTIIIDSVRRVFLEDYTGHKCTACPNAALAATAIKGTYGDSVVVVGVHAGFFATPNSSGTQYLENFQTTAGTAYDTYFGISSVGNPNGMVNRKDYDGTTTNHVKSYGSWAAEVAAELAKRPTAGIQIINSYNSSTRVLNCTVKSVFLYDTLSQGPYNLVVMMMQDSIIADQLVLGVYTNPYVHQHVLRDNLNGTWGENVGTAGSIVAGNISTKSYSYTLPAAYPGSGSGTTACNENQCYVIAFIYNDVTKEVIQVQEQKIK
ncbi:MAG: Omp28 family outer membrane lipoprotein [Bacteroidia bacterium]